MTSSQQFLDNLATRTTTGFTIPFDLKEHFSFTQLLVRTAQQTHPLVPSPSPRGAGRPGRGSGAGPLCHGAGVHDGLAVGGSPCREVVRGAVDGQTVRDWLVAVNDGVPANAVVRRPAIGFEIGVVCPCNGCCFKL